jgi:hypothetical protein
MPPQGAFRKGLHNATVTPALYVDPYQDKGAGQRHGGDQAAGGREPFREGGGCKDDDEGEKGLQQNLHIYRTFFYSTKAADIFASIQSGAMRLRAAFHGNKAS